MVCLLVCATAPHISAQTETPASSEQLKEQIVKLNTVETDASSPADLRVKTRNFLIEHRQRLRFTLQSELDALRNYRQSQGNALLTSEVKEITDAIGELEKNLQALNSNAVQPLSALAVPQVNPCISQPTSFCLSSPANKATDVDLEPLLSWTEPTSAVQNYLLQVSEDKNFTTVLFEQIVPEDPDRDGSQFQLKKAHRLEPGQTYYWRVRANYPNQANNSWDVNGPFSFKTTINFLSSLADKGFSLQKALTGPDKGELAEFAFLNTIGEKTVFSTTFALSWHPKTDINFKHTNLRLGASVEGALASDESKAEDAWRFRVSGTFVTNFIRCQNGQQQCQPQQLTRPTFEGLFYKGSLKLEGDKDFDVRKLSGEFLITPNSFALAIGAARPGLPSKPLQFQWRPFFSIDAGHTFRRGTSEEREDSILRLVPRVRTRVDLQFIRQWLNLNEVAIFADETFYYLPLENQRKRNNFFTSGIEFKFTPNVGFGLTYKNGRSAPKFEKINTLQGILGIRF